MKTEIRTQRSPRLLLATGILILASEASAAQFVYDLSQISQPPASAKIGGAYIFSITPTTSTGTGIYNTFLAIQGNVIESGFNSDLPTLMPDVDDSKTSDILVSNLSTATVSGINYYSFGLDINEGSGGGSEFLSIDRLQVWVRSTPLTSADTEAALTGSGATKVWDLDALTDSTVLLNYLISGSGSGAADVEFLLPQTLIDNVAGLDPSWNVYLFTTLGAAGTIDGNNFEANAGFEEWQKVDGFTFTTPAEVPEPGTVAAIWALTGLAGLGAWKHRRVSLSSLGTVSRV